MFKRIVMIGVVLVGGVVARAEEKGGTGGVVVDKEKKTVTVPAKVAARKINDPRYTEIYPIEAVATAPFPRGQKVHAALESLGLKPGHPAEGEDGVAEGPEVKVSVVLPSGKTVPIEKTLVDKKTGKAMPTLHWRFCGSARK